MKLNTILKEARKNRGLTQQQLADTIGLSRETVNAIERGHNALDAIELRTIVNWNKACGSFRKFEIAAFIKDTLK